MRGLETLSRGKLMTENEAPAERTAGETIAIAAATMGHDLTAALLAEVRNLPGTWSTLNAELQQKTIERFKEKISTAVTKALHMMTASEFQAVPASLEYVSRKGGIKAGLTVSPEALCRHALFDAQGQKVLIVIVDPARWLQRMDDLKATGNQQDLFDRSGETNYDHRIDQPGYRRDQDPFAPGPSWEELKKNLGGAPAEGSASPPPPAADPAAESDKPIGPPAGDDDTVDPHLVSLRVLQEGLATEGIQISLGALQSRSDADILAATMWLDIARSKGSKAAAKSRPAWFNTEGDSK